MIQSLKVSTFLVFGSPHFTSLWKQNLCLPNDECWLLKSVIFNVVSTLVLQASLREEKKLRVENAKLKKEIEGLKQELIQAEIRNGGGGKKSYPHTT